MLADDPGDARDRGGALLCIRDAEPEFYDLSEGAGNQANSDNEG